MLHWFLGLCMLVGALVLVVYGIRFVMWVFNIKPPPPSRWD